MGRTWGQVVDEAIEMLSVEALTITNFMYKMNVDYSKIKRIIQELDERGILEDFKKKTQSGRICIHYKVKRVE